MRLSPSGEHCGPMAYAHLYEAVHVIVLFDRIQRKANDPAHLYTLLAHVMTHEITHLLQGISRHSATGVMKARWGAKDVANMANNPLPFTPEDIDLIQCGLVRRAAGSASAVPPGTVAKLH